MQELIQKLLSDVVLRCALLVAGIALILSMMHGCSTDKTVASYEKQMKDWKAQSAQLIVQNTATKAMVDSLRFVNVQLTKVANEKSTTIQSLQSSQMALRKKNDSTLAMLRDSLPVICLPALDLATRYRAEGDSLKMALILADQRDSLRVKVITNQQISIDSLIVRNDSVITQLRKVPEYKAPKILGFIPLPTRKQSFGVGVVTGIVGTVAAIILHK